MIKTIPQKLDTIKDFLELHKRSTFHEGNQLVLNIKGSFYLDLEYIENILNKKYTNDFIDSLNLERQYNYFFECQSVQFFEYAMELFTDNNITNKIYQTGRSGGYLYIDQLYQELDDFIDNIENDFESIQEKNYNHCFYCGDTKKELHNQINKKLKQIKDIEKIFKILIEHKKDFETNNQKYFLNELNDYIIPNQIETLKEKINEYKNILSKNDIV